MLFRLASDTEDNDEALGRYSWPLSFLLRLLWSVYPGAACSNNGENALCSGFVCSNLGLALKKQTDLGYKSYSLHYFHTYFQLRFCKPMTI